MKIGLISDTHNYFDPRIPQFFESVEHILHAGDIGQREILRQLEAIAPVTAVSGNTDDPGFRYPLTTYVELAGVRFLLHHIVNPLSLTSEMEYRIKKSTPDVVVFGHTHKPFDQTVGKIRFLNPGYAGKARFALPRTLATAKIGNGKLIVTLIDL